MRVVAAVSGLRTNFDKTQLFRQSHIRPYTPI